MAAVDFAHRAPRPQFTAPRDICYSSPMIRTITLRKLRNHFAAVLREVQAGQTLIVTRNGVPSAELRPIQPRRLVPRAVIAEAARRTSRIDAKRFRAEADSLVDQSVDSRAELRSTGPIGRD